MSRLCTALLPVSVISWATYASASTLPEVLRLAAFAGDAKSGGNPAGVLLSDSMPDESSMRATAAEVGYSETVFSAPESPSSWRVRYFAPEAEVSFCGHATIALGAALALKHGDGIYALTLNDNVKITVEGRREGAMVMAALQSPPTSSVPADETLAASGLALFGLSMAQLDSRIPISVASAGSSHLVIALSDRNDLTNMKYDFELGKQLMRENGLTTIQLLHVENETSFCARCPFAGGGVYEDSATGSAAAALGGLLRDLGWPHHGRIELSQGVEMQMPSKLIVEIGATQGESVRVSGCVRHIDC